MASNPQGSFKLASRLVDQEDRARSPQDHDDEDLDIKKGSSSSHIENTHSRHEDRDVSAELCEPSYLKKLKRRIDLHVLPILTVTYSVSLIDRQNISNAKVAGMNQELGLGIGARYSICLLVFFAPYVLFELPSNLALRKVGAAKWLGTITVLWGATIVGMGFSTDWTHLVVCRILLGIFEAGFFPGCVYVISSWYTRYETGKRLSAFYLGSHIFSGLGGIVAAGLKTINVGKYHGWRWIFIVEGIFTVCCGVAALFLVVDFPEKAKFLSSQDKEIIMHHIDLDRSDAHADKITFKGILHDLSDWKIWAFGWNSCVNLVIAGVYTYFGQAILLSMGFSLDVALIMIFPTSVFAVIVGFVQSIYSDKLHLRAPFIIANHLCWIVGATLIGFTEPKAVRMIGIFLIVMGFVLPHCPTS
jgi:MFS family permease